MLQTLVPQEGGPTPESSTKFQTSLFQMGLSCREGECLCVFVFKGVYWLPCFTSMQALASKPNALRSHWLFNRLLTAQMGTHKCGFSLRLTQQALRLYEAQLKYAFDPDQRNVLVV